MFREDYKQCNEQIKPDPELIDNILKLNRRKVKIKYKRIKRSLLDKMGAVAACLLIIFSFISISYRLNVNKDFVLSANSYNQIYTVAQAMKRGDLDKFIDRFFDVLKGPFARKDVLLISGDVPANDINLAINQNYSDTNIQVSGVQEADIMKTDGEYIYTISKAYRNVIIYKAEGDDTKVVSTIKFYDDDIRDMKYYPWEMYVTNNRIVIIRSTVYGEETRVDIYDISDKTKPKYINGLGQGGYCLSSRMIGDTLYLLTNFVFDENYTKDPNTFIPYLINFQNNKGEKTLMDPSDISMIPYPKQYRYLVVTGIDTQNPEEHISSKAVFGSGDNVYANLENIYVASVTRKDLKDTTRLLRLSLDKGVVDVENVGSVPGRILNQFSMDEYDGYFRIVTQSDNEGSNLFVLDDKLKIIGRLEGLAKGESNFSVRFNGDIGYFVTAKMINYKFYDPLFTVDLSDPENPTIMSALDIPGYSSYLHPYGENLLFGLGRDTVTIKLSMFDVSDKTKVFEKHKFILDSKYRYSSALDSHKALLVAPNRNIIGFSAETDYLVFTYDENEGFGLAAVINIDDLVKINRDSSNVARGLYIGDYLYVYYPEAGLVVCRMDDFERVTFVFNVLSKSNNDLHNNRVHD